MNPLLRSLLELKRVSGSDTEQSAVTQFIDTIPGMCRDRYGNRIFMRNGLSDTIISVHTDTVHSIEGTQEIVLENDIVTLADILPDDNDNNDEDDISINYTSDFWREGHSILWNREINEDYDWNTCLGADDAAGMYAAIRMIQAGVRATFIFHRDEEIGGRGSQWLAANMRDFLEPYKRAIALDRRGTSDIVTVQQGESCCSNEFAMALGTKLGMLHAPAIGSFTDTANYTGLISECTNVSIGYYNEHTAEESLDIAYLEGLIDRLCTVSLNKLPTVRKVVTGAKMLKIKSKLREIKQ